jgi:signal transduction protein with GAF and PtsI domain
MTLEEITNLTQEGGKPADTLMNVVALIATRFRTDVCSAYLLEPDRSNLVLAATLGLHPRCIGTLRMPLNEGLAGLVAEQVLAGGRRRRASIRASSTSRSRAKRSTTRSWACR